MKYPRMGLGAAASGLIKTLVRLTPLSVCPRAVSFRYESIVTKPDSNAFRSWVASSNSRANRDIFCDGGGLAGSGVQLGRAGQKAHDRPGFGLVELPAGFFGDPVYVPGVSEALVEAKIVEASNPVAKPKIRMVAEAKPVEPATVQPPATGSAAIVNRVADLRNDPEFAKLTPRQRRAVTGKEVRQMVRSGEATREDVRTAVRQLAQDADPATKEAWRKAAADRREKRIERREALRNATPEERAEMLQALRERRQARLSDPE